MKKLLFLSLLFSLLLASCVTVGQVKITDMPTFVGNPAGAWVPIVLGGINRKMDAAAFGYNKVDFITRKIGTDSLFYVSNNQYHFISEIDTSSTITTGKTYVKSSLDSMLAVPDGIGTVVVRTDSSKSFVLKALPASSYDNWVQLLFPASMQSFNGRTGVVRPDSLDYSEYYLSLGNAYTKSKIDSIKTQYVADIASLQAYAGSANTVVVQDSLRGGIFSYVASGLTADDGTVFNRSGGGYWKRGNISGGYLNVNWFGMVPDANPSTGDGTDGTLALKNAVAAAAKINGTVDIPKAAKGYVISSTINIPANVSINMDGTIYYNTPSSDTTAAFVIADTSLSGLGNGIYKINVAKPSTKNSDWLHPNSDCAGVKFINISHANIFIKAINGFTSGAIFAGQSKIGGSTSGTVYNTINVNTILNCRQALWLVADSLSGSATPYVDANNFYGGTLTFTSSSTNSGLSRYGIRITDRTGANAVFDSNNFYGFDFELFDSYASPNEAIPVLIESHSTYNHFFDCRTETNTLPNFARIKSAPPYQSSYNLFSFTSTVGSPQIQDSTPGKNNFIIIPSDTTKNLASKQFLSNNYLAKTGGTLTGALNINDALGNSTLNGAGYLSDRLSVYFGSTVAGGSANIKGDLIYFLNHDATKTLLLLSTTARLSIPLQIDTVSNAAGQFVTRDSATRITHIRTSSQVLTDLKNYANTGFNLPISTALSDSSEANLISSGQFKRNFVRADHITAGTLANNMSAITQAPTDSTNKLQTTAGSRQLNAAIQTQLKAKADTGTVNFITTKGVKSDTTSNPGYTTLSVDSAYVMDSLIKRSQGTYTPTITGVANYTAGTSYVCQYSKVGKTVTVWGKVTVQPTAAATITTFSLSLPTAGATTFTGSYQGAGTGGGIFSNVYYPYIISSSSSGSVLNVSFISNQTSGQQDCQFQATYQIQ